jgi:hypothetical protein
MIPGGFHLSILLLSLVKCLSKFLDGTKDGREGEVLMPNSSSGNVKLKVSTKNVLKKNEIH